MITVLVMQTNIRLFEYSNTKYYSVTKITVRIFVQNISVKGDATTNAAVSRWRRHLLMAVDGVSTHVSPPLGYPTPCRHPQAPMPIGHLMSVLGSKADLPPCSLPAACLH